MAKQKVQTPSKGQQLTSNLLDKTKVRKGRLIRVWNQQRKFGANEKYVSVWVEDANGKNERCLLFSEDQIEVAATRAAKNKEDLTKKNWVTDKFD